MTNFEEEFTQDGAQDAAADASFDVGPGVEEAVVPAQDRVITLPPGAELENLEVDGRDLIIILSDGSRVVVADGAVFVPQIVVNGVAVPPLNIAELLTGNEPEPAAGPAPSSGGNFAGDEGEIQAAYEIGDLLPFTDFSFPEEIEEEIFPTLGDEEPEIEIQTPDNPAGAQDVTANVGEDGLPPREGEPAGTDEASDSETTSGTIVFNSPDGPSDILINGTEITGPGQTIPSPFGTLTIISFDPVTGEIDFEYTLGDNTTNPGDADIFNVTVIDADGDEASATLTINIQDDGPIAADDTNTVPAGSFEPVSGDVLINDVPGADGYAASGAVSGFSNDGGSAEPGQPLQGEFGVLTLNPDGTYSYTRDPGTPGGVSDTFTYTIVDQDGSTSTATLTIDIGDSPAAITFVPVVGEGTEVSEGGLPPRGDEPVGSGEGADADPNNNSDPSESTGSAITFESPDGIGEITIGGTPVVIGDEPQEIEIDGGTLIITEVTFDPITGEGSITYDFTLDDNTDGDDTTFDVDIVVTDLDGDSAEDTLTINVVDDVPTAIDDTASQTEEDAPVTVDVFANDIPGADGVALDTITVVDDTLSGDGTLVNNGDGTFIYTPAPGEEGNVTFDYTITDSDGDTSTATVTIELLEDSEPEIGINELGAASEDTVAEAGLDARGDEPAGSDAPSDSETSSGVIAIATGNDTIGSLVINGVDVTEGGTVTTDLGVLTVTENNGVYSYTYELTDNTLADPDSDTFTLTVTDSDGDTASTDLIINIVDDVPAAEDDANSLDAGEFGPATGNVLGNDTQGADGADVTGFTGLGGSGAPGDTIQGEYGVLTLNADGTYSYTRDPGTPGGVTDTFTYTITDGDGDTAQADLVITIADAPVVLTLPVEGDAGTQVEEDGLAGPPAGSDAASDSELTSGVFTFTAPDGPATVTIGGVEVTTVGQTFTGAFGTLTIDAIEDGAISYTYELTTNTDGDATSDSFDVVVTDQDGDTADGTLDIAIVDDVPTAVADTDSVTEDGQLTATGNVLTDAEANGDDGADTTGADGASVTGVAAGDTGADVAGDVDASVTGAYGAITIGADGSYTYELDNQNALVQGLDATETLTDTFTYTITDGDGDTSTTTVTVTINGADDPVVINDLVVGEPELVVDEDDLADGSSPDAGALTQSGSFSVDSQDGLATLTIGGVPIFGAGVTYPVAITGDYGTVSITSVTPVLDANGDTVSLDVAYEYVLSENTIDHSDPGQDSLTDSFDVVATDTDGSSANSTLDVQVIDDVPTAVADSDFVADDVKGEATGNVLTDAEANGDDGADTPGADGATVTGVATGSSTADVTGSVGTAITGAYGDLTLNDDGSYSYVLDQTNPLVEGLDGTESLIEVFTYTITDGDGDTATTTLTIRVDGADDPVVVNGLDLAVPELSFDEDDLADGSSPDASALTKTGSFTIESQDGLASLTVGGATVFGAGVVFPVTIDDPVYGILTITGVTPVTDANGDVVSATVEYSYTLDDNSLRHDLAGEDSLTDSFEVIATDTDGSSDSASLDIQIIDDVPDVEASGLSAPLLITDDTDVGDNGTDTASASFANLFDTTFGADGPAASDDTTYALSINGGDGTDSGLNDTATGDDILLRVNGDAIEGYLAGDTGVVAFTLTLDPATGEITQTQSRAIQHDDPTDPAETGSAAETLAADLISLTATVTDGDGDVDSASVDIGGSFAFEDDGPAFGTTLIGITKDEDDLAGGNGDSAPGDNGNVAGTNFPFQIDFGADGANADEITVSVTAVSSTSPNIGDIALTSGGDAVQFDWDASTNTLTGFTTDIGDPVLTLVFDVTAGTVDVNYFKPVDHPASDADGSNDGPEAGFEDNIQLTFDITVTDGDGDTNSSSLVLTIDDDMAIAVADTAAQTAENQSFTIDALANDAFGADGVDTSDPTKVFVSDQGTQGTVSYDPATGVFTYVPAPGAGSNGNTTDTFDYTIIDGDGDASTATVTVTLQPDSEPLGGEAVATVDDDGLAGGNAASTTGDLDANLGDAPTDLSEATFTGTVDFSVGNDTPATVTFDASLNGSTAAIGQETVAYAVVGNVLTATVTGGARDGTDLFTVEITDAATGAYIVTLLDNVIHGAGDNENNALASIDFTVTDSDGDTALTNLGIVFDDDAPTAADDLGAVDEGGMTAGNVLTGDVAGADGFGPDGAVVAISNGSTSQTTVDAAGNLVLSTALGTLTVNAQTGAYTYESNANSTNVDVLDSFTYTITDGDGDEVTANLVINISDEPSLVSDNDVLVNEAGLPTGSDAGSGSATDTDGQISVMGASGTLVFSLAGSVAGPNANEVQIDGAFGTIVLNTQTGAYTYTLDTPFTDTVDENGANVVNAAEAFTYEVRDTAGNLIGGGSIDVSIIDDVPTATDQAAISVAEDAAGTIGGNVVTDGTPDTPGADGATVTAITIDGITTIVPQDGSDATVVTANGTYTINQTGAWTFDPNPNLDQTSGAIDASFTYTLTDSDGDFDTAEQPITITDGAGPVAGPDIALALDDANLADGSTPANADDASDTITFTPGSDDIASIVFGGVTGLDPALTWVRVSDTEITASDGGRLVVTLDLSVANNVATVTATLNDNFDDHPVANADDLFDLGDVSVVATDTDGDTASATASISVSDDLPTITASAPAADTLTVDESFLGLDAKADFSGLFNLDANADNLGTPVTYALGTNAGATGLVDTATGQAVVLTLEAGDVVGRNGDGDIVFTVSVDAAGEVTLDQQRAVVHADSVDDNDPATLNAANLITLTGTIVDSDGDSASATADIGGALTFLDDGPSLSNVGLGSSVSVDETGGLDSATSTDSILSFMSDFGEDGANGTAFTLGIVNSNSGLATAVGDYPITLVQTNATTITGQFNDGTSVQDAFNVVINADGTVTLTQIVALEHNTDGPAGPAHDDTLDLAGLINATVTITDGDNDTDSATLEIGGALTFFDDGPSVTLSGTDVDLTVAEATTSFNPNSASQNFSNVFAFDGGEDGTGDISYALQLSANGVDSGLVTTDNRPIFLFLENGEIVGRYAFNGDPAPTGAIAFTVSVDDTTGIVTLTSFAPINHANSSGDGNFAANVLSDDLIQLVATITDTDGDTDSVAHDIGSDLLITDTSPTAAADTDTVTEGGFTQGDVTTNDTTGADRGLEVIGVAAGNVAGPLAGNVGTFFNGQFGRLDLNADGTYTYESFPDVVAPPGAVDVFTYTITDQDGDTSTTTLTINISDVSLVGDDETAVVNEAALDTAVDGDDLAAGTVTGSNPGSTDETVSGQVTVAGTGVTYAINGSATGNNGVISLDPNTGEFVYTLTSPVAGSTANDGTNTVEDVESFTYTATDANGNTVTGTITIDVIDDVPTANADTNTLTEDTVSVGGNVLTDGTPDEFGADGEGTPPVVAVTGFGGAVGAVNGATAGEFGTLTLNDDGTYTYNLNTALVQGLDDGETETDTFTYTIVDADGDQSTTTLTITITGDNDAPVAIADTNFAIEDAAAPSTGNVLQDIVHTGAPSGTFADVADTDVDGDTLTVSTTGTFAGTYGTLTLNADGSYSYDLDDNNPAVQALNEGDTPLTDTFNYTATDGDASNASTLTISIFGTNDAPVVGTAVVATSDEGLAGGLADTAGNPTDTTNSNVANGTIAISDVDDTAFTVTLVAPTETLSSGGETITWSLSADGKTLTGSTTSAGAVLTVVIDDAGAFTVTQLAQIDHADTTSEDVTNFTVDVSVNDGTDTTTQINAITVNLEDDSPEITTPIDDEQVLNDPGEAPLVGDLNFAPGGDGPGSATMIMADVSAITVGGSPIITSQTGNVLTGFVDSDGSGDLSAGDLEVFTLAVDPAAGASGEYTFDLLVPVDGETTKVTLGTGTAFGVGPSDSVLVTQAGVGELTFVTGWNPTASSGELTPAELANFLAGGTPPLNQDPSVNGSTAGFGLGSNNFDEGQFVRFDFGALDDYDGAGTFTPPGGTNVLNASFATFDLKNFSSNGGNNDVVHFVARYTDGTSETFTLDAAAGDASLLTINAPPGALLSYVDVYNEEGSVKLNLIDVGVTETTVDVDIPVSVKLTDSDGDSAMDDFVITLFDDAPDAQDDLNDAILVTEDINAAFVLDFSGSVDNAELNLQLNAVKDAAFELFESTTGDLDITLVTFSTTAQTEGTFSDFASFAAALDGLNNELGGTRSFAGLTNFTDAVEQVIADFVPDAAANNQVFFLSDGNPNEETGTNGNSLSDAAAAAWQAFIDANDINVTAIGVGGGINTARLQDVDLDGEGAPILADEFDDLVDTLISVVTPEIGGSVLDNDTAATNGISVIAITVDGVNYAFDGLNTITPGAGTPIAGTLFTATTAFGGELTFDFADGSYTYTPPATTVPEIENFQYTVIDGDNDIDTAVLRIDIAAVAENNNFALNDVVITNTGSTVEIDEAFLLANDEAGTAIASVGNASDGSVSQAGGTVTFTDTGDASGGFTYAATNGGDTNNAFVTVNREQAGQSQLDGTSGDDILIGRDGANDILVGNEGADILLGGTGADVFTINDGDSIATVGGSGDNGTITGFDTIVDYDASVDDINFTDNGSRITAFNTPGINGVDSTLTIGGQTIKSHSISDGIITFSTSNTFSGAVTLMTESDVAAVVDYLQSQGTSTDIGENRVVAFVVGGDTFLFNQDRPTGPLQTEDSLVKIEGVVLTDLGALVSAGAVRPVVLDLDGDGAEFVGISAGVTYDYDGDGTLEATAWAGADDAILAYDADGNGLVSDASEFVFGNAQLTDLEAVAARFDDNGDGVLDASDAAYSQFGIWQDADLDGVNDDGEFTSLEDAGIASINLVSDGVESQAAGGDVTIFGKSAFTYTNGQTGEVADAAFATDRQNRTLEQAAAAAAGFAAFAVADHATSFVPVESVELEAAPTFSVGVPSSALPEPAQMPGFDLSDLLPGVTEMGGDQISVSLVAADDGDWTASSLTLASDVELQDAEPLLAQAAETDAFASGPVAGGFDGASVAQSMEALLLLDTVATETIDGTEVETGETVHAILADIAATSQLDQIIDNLSQTPELADKPVFEFAGLDSDLLNQTFDLSINPAQSLDMMDGQLEQAAAASAQA